MAGANPQKNLVATAVVVVLLVIVGSQFVKTIPEGQVGVATLFGNVQPDGFTQGLHFQ